MINYIKLIAFILIISACSHKKTKIAYNGDDISDKGIVLPKYEYDTVLKNGYSIRFQLTDTSEDLYLVKGLLSKKIASASIGVLYKSLGYKIADFNGYFILAHSFGSGNPTFIELINKSNGLSILNPESAWIGADEKRELLFYSETGLPSNKDSIVLFNLNTNTKTRIPFPEDLFSEPQILNRIHLDTVSNSYLIIKFESKNTFKRKKYFLQI